MNINIPVTDEDKRWIKKSFDIQPTTCLCNEPEVKGCCRVNIGPMQNSRAVLKADGKEETPRRGLTVKDAVI